MAQWHLKTSKAVARSIKERLANAVSYRTYEITNAVAAGINGNKIMANKRRVGDDRNRENFKTSIIIVFGELDHYAR